MKQTQIKYRQLSFTVGKYCTYEDINNLETEFKRVTDKVLKNYDLQVHKKERDKHTIKNKNNGFSGEKQ